MATPLFSKPLSQYPTTVRVREWRKDNPERWAEGHRRAGRRHILRDRPLCRDCSMPLPYPATGRRYCESCCLRIGNKGRRGRRKLFEEMSAYKLSRGCDNCGYVKCVAALDFHHRDPGTRKHKPINVRDPEIKKCDLLCKNCHAELHHQKRAQNGDVI